MNASGRARALIAVPARGGSKGLPGKNLRTVGGLSLVAHAVRAGRRFARRSGLADAIVLVDTDSEAIAEEGRRWGAAVPWLRPPELALDTTPTLDSILHAVARARAELGEVDAVVLLQPTSPLRRVEDIAACWARYAADARPSVVSVVRAGHPPEMTLRADEHGLVRWAFTELRGGPRRQDFAPAFRPNGAVYVTSVRFLEEERTFLAGGRSIGVEMPPERSVDIDDAADLRLAHALAAEMAPRAHFGAMAQDPGRPPCVVRVDAGEAADVAALARAGAAAMRIASSHPDAAALADAAARAGLAAYVGDRLARPAAPDATAPARLLALGEPALAPGLVDTVDAAADAGDAVALSVAAPTDRGVAAVAAASLRAMAGVLQVPVGWSCPDAELAWMGATAGAAYVEIPLTAWPRWRG